MRWPWPPRRSLPHIRLVLDLANPDRCTLDGATVRLRPAEFALLAALAQHPGRALTWARLYCEIWTAETFVEPGQLYSHRSRLAKALGDPRLIETVPKHGLRLALQPHQVHVIHDADPP